MQSAFTCHPMEHEAAKIWPRYEKKKVCKSSAPKFIISCCI